MTLASAVLADSVKTLARELGFDRVAIGPAAPPARGEALRQWLDRGYAGTMAYIGRRLEERLDPARVLPGAASVVCVALNYYQGEPGDRSWLPVARYAWGRDYHDVMIPRLERIALHLGESCGAQSRAYVDTGPVLERELAARAASGGSGRTPCCSTPTSDRGSSSACCSRRRSSTRTRRWRTGAAAAGPASTPARRARSRPRTCSTPRAASPYPTIEHRGPIAPELEAGIGAWQFGCDACQTACPWNRKAPVSPHAEFRPSAAYPGAEAVAAMSDEDLRARFAGTALTRARADGLRRNARIALENRRAHAPGDAR